MLLAIATCACASRYRPLSHELPELDCAALGAELEGEGPIWHRRGGVPTTDPLLGWSDDDFLNPPGMKPATNRSTTTLAAAGEPSLADVPDEWEVYRAMIRNEYGPSLIVRVVNTTRRLILIAKVVEGRPEGARLIWNSVHPIEMADWKRLRESAEQLPWSTDEFSRPPREPSERNGRRLACFYHGAYLKAERARGGSLSFTRSIYGTKITGACADAHDVQVTRFANLLRGMVRCG